MPRPEHGLELLAPKLSVDQADVNPDLLSQQVVQGRAVPKVHPVARRSVLLLVLALAEDNIIVALGARFGRRQPDLLIGRLLVDDICAMVGTESEGEDAGLRVC